MVRISELMPSLTPISPPAIEMPSPNQFFATGSRRSHRQPTIDTTTWRAGRSTIGMSFERQEP
jgi:hypothetical protein